MYNFNRVILMGRLTKNPIFKAANGSHSQIAEISIATNSIYTDDQNNKQNEVCYIDCVAFGKKADSLNNNFSIGRPILIEGRLKYEQWTDNSGKKCSKHKVKINRFEYIDNKPAISSEPVAVLDGCDVL